MFMEFSKVGNGQGLYSQIPNSRNNNSRDKRC